MRGLLGLLAAAAVLWAMSHPAKAPARLQERRAAPLPPFDPKAFRWTSRGFRGPLSDAGAN